MADERFYAGLDLGQAADYSALLVVERSDGAPAEYDVVAIKRWPLGTSYVDIVEQVDSMLDAPALLGKVLLSLDATGVGRPVVDMLRQKRRAIGVTITSGELASGDGDEWRVPLKDLAGILRVLMDAGRLKVVPTLREAAELERQWQAFRMKFTEHANATFGAAGGHHDDEVLALAIALWTGERSANTPKPAAASIVPRAYGGTGKANAYGSEPGTLGWTPAGQGIYIRRR